VVARRHAAALARRGFDVVHAAPRGESPTADPYRVEIYATHGSPRDPWAPKRHDAVAVAALRALIARYRPDVVYDAHGPAWAVEAASEAGVPVVSMMGDYNWYCLQSFLVDARVRRCSGPGDGRKCFDCVNRWHRFPQRMAHLALKPAAQAGVIRLPIWDKLLEATDYLSRLRALISTFVVGDRKAYEFLVDHGIATSRIARIVQGLPADALVRRARAPDAAPGARNLRFAFVGRADADKGLHVLARAFDSLPRDLPAELWIVHKNEATYPYLRRLFPSRRRFAADLANGRIRLLRPKSQAEVFELMAQADVGVIPSIAFESPCLAMLEFVAQGTPVLRSESLGMQHVIQDGVNGRTFPHGDWRALAGEIRAIAEDPGVLARWRAALPPIQDDDEYARQLEGVFDALRSPRPAPTRRVEELHA
jgi:glycosyltransferase involved in cell wall biosynthesis